MDPLPTPGAPNEEQRSRPPHDPFARPGSDASRRPEARADDNDPKTEPFTPLPKPGGPPKPGEPGYIPFSERYKQDPSSFRSRPGADDPFRRSAADPAGRPSTEPPRSEPSRPSTPPRSEPSRPSTPPRSEPAGPSAPSAGRSEPGRPESARPDLARPGQTGSEAGRRESPTISERTEAFVPPFARREREAARAETPAPAIDPARRAPLERPTPESALPARDDAGWEPSSPLRRADYSPPAPTTAVPRRSARQRAKADARADVDPRATANVRKVRRGKLAIRKINPWAVLRFSAVFYFCMLLIVLLGTALVFVVMKAFGVIDSLEKVLRNLQINVAIDGGTIFRWQFLLGVVGCLVATAVTVFMAFLYNLIADVVGGVEITVAERE